jgi:hypothetical protein
LRRRRWWWWRIAKLEAKMYGRNRLGREQRSMRVASSFIRMIMLRLRVARVVDR